MDDLWTGPETVSDWIEALSKFPSDWPVRVDLRGGGAVGIEHRELSGKPAICIFAKNGGRFGENPLTELEYLKKSAQFLRELQQGKAYTSDYGDHRLYWPSFDSQSGCYGTHYDGRIIERMVHEGLIAAGSVDIARVAHFEGRSPHTPEAKP